MSDKPLVSIPILTYNGGKYLEEQLDSIFQQTYPNIEVLVFDDGSTDNTIEILKKYHDRYGLHYTQNKKNLGFIKNADKSFQACKGDYIAPCDQDDIWDKNKIETLVNEIADNVLIYSDSIPIDSHGKQLADEFFQSRINLIEGDDNFPFLLNNCVSAHTMLFKKELLPYITPIPENVLFHDWWVSFVATSYGSIKFFTKPLNFYRRHEDQVTLESKKDLTFNIVKKLRQKEKKLMIENSNLCQQLSSFSHLSILDPQTRDLILTLKELLEQYPSIYYNTALENFLKIHQKRLFQIYKEENTLRIIKKLCKGRWYHRLRMYS